MFELDFARQQISQIAAEFTEDISETTKSTILAQLDRTFDEWKRGVAEATTDGCIEQQVVAGGLLGPSFWPVKHEMSLAEITSGKPLRIPVNDLAPWECAGPTVRCAPELFLHLTTDPGARDHILEGMIDRFTAYAVLVERDAETMPPVSLVTATRVLWTYNHEFMKSYREMLVSEDRRRADIRAAANAKSAAERTDDRNRRVLKALELAGELRARDPSAKRFAIADAIRNQWVSEGLKGADLPSIATIEDYIKGAYR